MAKPFTLNYGFRGSFMPQAFLEDNKLAAFVPSAYDPKLGTSPCNGIVLAPGPPNGCSAAGLAGGCYSTNRRCNPTNYHPVPPRLVFARHAFRKKTLNPLA